MPTEIDKMIPWIRFYLLPIISQIIDFQRVSKTPYIFIVLFLFGMIILFREKRDLFICIISTTLIILLVSAFNMYPIVQRLLIFWFPMAYIPIVFALVFLLNKILRNKKFISICLIIFTTYTVYGNYNVIKTSIRYQETQDLIDIINTNNNKYTQIVVSSAATLPYRYYQMLNQKNNEYVPFNTFGNSEDIIKQIDNIINKAKEDNKKEILFLYSFFSRDRERANNIINYLRNNNYNIFIINDVGSLLLVIYLDNELEIEDVL